LAVAHGARLWIAPPAAEALRALAIAFAQLFAAVRVVLDLVAVGIIDEPKLAVDMKRHLDLGRQRKFFGTYSSRWGRSNHPISRAG
jgi:hypothetical protein